jgi:hypothetical protein
VATATNRSDSRRPRQTQLVETDDRDLVGPVYGLTLVTRNVRDFAAIGVTLFNPFESP